MSAAVEETPSATKQAPPSLSKKLRKPITTSHPPYFQMVKDALLSLNEKSGSSPYAISKYMEDKHKSVLPPNFRKILGQQLKNCVANGKLIKIKASYKLSEAGKKEKRVAAVAKPDGKKPKSTNKKVVGTPKTSSQASAKKKVISTPKKITKKTAASAKPKQPKSIKSPSTKRAKRASAD